MEIFGFLAAVLGLITAIINRKRFIVHRYETDSYSSYENTKPPVTIGKRFKRLAICVGVAFVCAMIGGSAMQSNKELSNFMVWPFAICMLVGAY
jgi:hypothetical protein